MRSTTKDRLQLSHRSGITEHGITAVALSSCGSPLGTLHSGSIVPPVEQPEAQIVVSFLPAGKAQVRTFWRGEFDSFVVARCDADVLAKDVPLAFAELRAQIDAGRRLTPSESTAIRARIRAGLQAQSRTTE